MNADENEDATDDSWRDDPEWHGNRFPAWDSDVSALRAARREARESLEETITSIRRIDESAMKTLRVDLVIIGLSLTVASSFRFTGRFVNELTVLGCVAVGISAVVAAVPTLASDYPTGVSEAYIEELQQASWSEREWNEWMLREYGSWLAEASRMVNGEARLLFYSRSLLGVGLLALLLGTALGIAGVLDGTTGLEMALDIALVRTKF